MKIVIPQKVVLNLIRCQLEPICESLPHEVQCGFRKLRGCIDAMFNVRLGLKKRQEHDLETVAFFVGFVKAFDRVPRALLWKVLDELGAITSEIGAADCGPTQPGDRPPGRCRHSKH